MLNKNDLVIDCISKNDSQMIVDLILEKGFDPNTSCDDDNNTCLHYAIMKNADSEFIKLLLNLGANVKLKNKQGMTPLDIAISNSNYISFEIMANSDSNQEKMSQKKAPSKRDLFLEAIRKGDLLQIEKFLLNGASPNIRIDKDANTPLHFAVNTQNNDMIQLLLCFKADPQALNKKLLTPLQSAIQDGFKEGVVSFSQFCIVDAASEAYYTNALKEVENNRFNNNNSPEAGDEQIAKRFIEAVNKGDDITIQSCLELGVSPNVFVDENNNTALHIAVKRNNFKLIKLLMNSGIQLIKNKDQLTALQMAIHQNNFDVANYIEKNNQCLDNDGALNEGRYILSVLNNKTDLLANYLIKGISPNTIIDAEGNTALHIAIKEGYSELIALLIANKADMLQANYRGTTPLQVLLDKKNTLLIGQFISKNWVKNKELMKCHETLYLLSFKTSSVQQVVSFLANGVSPDLAIDENGNTALHIAIMTNNIFLLKTLLYYNANPSVPNKLLKTPLDLAYQMQKWEILKTLSQDYQLSDQDAKQCRIYLLIHALETKDSSEITLAFKNGVSPMTVINSNNNTVLHYAVEKNDMILLKLLLEYQPNIFCKNNQGFNVIDLALSQNNWPCLTVLTRYLVSKNVDSSYFHVLISRAIEAKAMEVIKILLNANVTKYFSSMKGQETIAQLLQDSSQSGFLRFLFVEDKSGFVQDLVFQKGELSESLANTNFFVDEAVEFDVVKEPYILPQGNTYDQKQVAQFKECPMTRAAITPQDFIPNRKVRELMAYFKLPDIDIEEIPPALICPETGKIYQNPVVALDGYTYEKDWLTDYLKQHDNKTPQGTLQTRAPYPNRMLDPLIEQYSKVVSQDKANLQKFSFSALPPKQQEQTTKISKMEIDDNYNNNAFGFR